MPRYIVRPRGLHARGELSLATTRLNIANRRQQRDRLRQLILDNEATRDIAKFVKATKNRIVRRISGAIEQASALGTQVLEMEPAAAAELSAEGQNYIVLRDRPMQLIEPVRTQGHPTQNPAEDSLWHLEAIGLTGIRQAGFNATGKGVHIAVLDTGANGAHEEIKTKIDRAVSFDVDTWTTKPVNPIETDTLTYHGTHVSGLICGDRVGIAPDSTITAGIMLPAKQGMLSDFVLALEWVALQDEIQLVNLSAGLPGVEAGMREALMDLQLIGVFTIAAAGNDGRNATRSPANLPGCLSVGACGVTNRIPSWSSSGAIIVDGHRYNIPEVVAPGDGVMSCTRTKFYEAMEGTSMATPIVTGIAALVLEQQPDVSINELDDVLIRSCTELPGEHALRQGAGIVKIGDEIVTQAGADTDHPDMHDDNAADPVSDASTPLTATLNGSHDAPVNLVDN